MSAEENVCIDAEPADTASRDRLRARGRQVWEDLTPEQSSTPQLAQALQGMDEYDLQDLARHFFGVHGPAYRRMWVALTSELARRETAPEGFRFVRVPTKWDLKSIPRPTPDWVRANAARIARVISRRALAQLGHPGGEPTAWAYRLTPPGEDEDAEA